MSEPTAPRPRPRPRPRPVAKAAPAIDASSVTAAGPSTVVVASTHITIQDEDELFIKNRKRSNVSWQKLKEAEKKAAPKALVINSDSDSDQAASPRRRKYRKRSEPKDAPKWQQDKVLERLLSVEVSDGSAGEDEIQILEAPNGTGNRLSKRPVRERSRSITPPPELPVYQVQSVRAIVRQQLNADRRAPSPTHFDADESTDTIILDPELQRIAKAIVTQSQSFPHSESTPSETGDTVMISVKWQPHPSNPSGKSETWNFKMNRGDNFRDLFDATAEEAQVLTRNLVMSFDGKRLFPSATPQTLKIWNQADFVASDARTYEYIKANPHSILPSMIEPREVESAFGRTGHAQTSDAESESDEDKFKIILRSSLTPADITLTVRPTTKCGAIVKAFLKKAGLADKYPAVFASPPRAPKKNEKDPRLCIDGDKLGNGVEISEMDLEDGDMVEVVGL